jgi:hypothetical protein
VCLAVPTRKHLYAKEIIRRSACLATRTNQADLPIDGSLAVFHMDVINRRRSRFVSRILTPFEAMRSYVLLSKYADRISFRKQATTDSGM